jgi:hypothetical protein
VHYFLILIRIFFDVSCTSVKPTFAKRIQERRESDRTISHLRYDDFRRMGYLRPITVRLPVTTLAKLDLLDAKLEKAGGKVWDSRQETIFEMIEACISDYTNGSDSPERTDEEFQAVARRSMQVNPPARGEDTEEPDDI